MQLSGERALLIFKLVKELGIEMYTWLHLKWITRGFLGGPVVKNLPCNAGDTGLIPGLGNFHMSLDSKAHARQLLGPHSRAREVKLLSPLAATTKPHVHRTCTLQLGKPLQ